MSGNSSIGIGVIGLGFIGQHHVRAYQAAAASGHPCRLAAVHDPNWDESSSKNAGNIATREGDQPLFDANEVRIHSDIDSLLADAAVQVVSICTYTDTHVDLALRALAARKHVLVEKPVAIKSAEVRRLADAARNARTHCMPAMCMRFWPGWDWLHDRICDRTFGEVRSATFQRLGSCPSWARKFYADPSRSGGALFDLHIHDVDFIYWCFGRPAEVTSCGSLMHMTSHYRFQNGSSHITAEGAWDLTPSVGFRMRYLVCFEHATADFDINRTPKLVVHDSNDSQPIKLPDQTGYDVQVRAFLAAVQDGSPLRATLNDAVAVTEILESEQQQLVAARRDRA